MVKARGLVLAELLLHGVWFWKGEPEETTEVLCSLKTGKKAGQGERERDSRALVGLQFALLTSMRSGRGSNNLLLMGQ